MYICYTCICSILSVYSLYPTSYYILNTQLNTIIINRFNNTKK